MNSLAIEGFLSTPAGVAVLAVTFTALAILLIALNYRFFTKAALDIMLSALLLMILSPLFIGAAIYSKSKYGRVNGEYVAIGKDGKIVYLHNFAGGALKNLPRILDVFLLRLSIVGPKIMPADDCALLEDEDMRRFAVRPGLISPVSVGGAESYEDMFEKDKKYCEKVRITRDIASFFCAAISAIRGDGRAYLGEAANKSYAEVLLERGSISASDVQAAKKLAQNAKIR